MSIRLRRRGCICWHRCAQITETGHCNHSYAALCQRSGKGHTLVIAATAAVNRQQRHARTGHLIFDVTASRWNNSATNRDTRMGGLYIVLKAYPDDKHCKDRSHTNGEKNWMTRD